jgi:cyclin D1/2/4
LQERVSQCLEAIIQATVALPLPTTKTDGPIGGGGGRSSSSLSVPRSPTGVLDAGCLSYRSDDTTSVAASHASSWCDENDSSPIVCSKRRKISR